jgi:hypothetical protein
LLSTGAVLVASWSRVQFPPDDRPSVDGFESSPSEKRVRLPFVAHSLGLHVMQSGIVSIPIRDT